MPGGNRGLIDRDVALSLNTNTHEETADAIIMWLESGDYQIVVTPAALDRAYQSCIHHDSLTKVFCAALKCKGIASEYGGSDA